MFRALILTIAVLLTGCATAPDYRTMQQETTRYNLPRTPDKGSAVVFVVRPSYLLQARFLI
jgi:starvation-inducible outer membrane lipoprotein